MLFDDYDVKLRNALWHMLIWTMSPLVIVVFLIDWYYDRKWRKQERSTHLPEGPWDQNEWKCNLCGKDEESCRCLT